MRTVLFAVLAIYSATLTALSQAAEDRRPALWIDLCEGEPIAYDEVVADLAGARVIYLGERHSLARHHEIQAGLVGDLARQGTKLVLGLEPMESVHQPHLDRYARGEITFEQLAETTQWAKRWRGYEGYRAVLEAARKAGAPILGLNARIETIRQIARSGGVDKLDSALRAELPGDMRLSDPPYEKFLNLQMMVHAAATPERLRPMVEAQIARDEAMAATLVTFLQSEAGRGRTAIVVCGAGHAAYGLGMPARVQRRMPGVKDRIVLLSESGDVELSPEDKAQARPITITHDQLRALGRPVADYLHARALADEVR
ncbi:MAG: ChaN family lipoprotein [Thermoguttaceae bacterium]|nr:ChaN family lipoprotein [Thermoguttaceae bacterium]